MAKSLGLLSLEEMAAKYISISGIDVGWDHEPTDQERLESARLYRAIRARVTLAETVKLLDQAREVHRMVHGAKTFS